MKIDLAVVDPENSSHISIFEGGSGRFGIYYRDGYIFFERWSD